MDDLHPHLKLPINFFFHNDDEDVLGEWRQHGLLQVKPMIRRLRLESIAASIDTFPLLFSETRKSVLAILAIELFSSSDFSEPARRVSKF